jgi:hypothetical protein
MVAPAFTSFSSPERRLAVFAALAVLLHALLLLVPSQRVMPPVEALRHLSVSLHKASPPPGAPRATQEPAPVPADAPWIQDEVRPTQSAPVPDEEGARVLESLENPSGLTTARLLNLAGRREWGIDAPTEKPRLGAPQHRPQPRNLQGGIAAEANLLDAAVVPERVEIVDRWRAADGSHNVVVNTPSGETYCGRAEAWSPINPLFEPIMTWRPCGEGGKRSFQMPERLARASAGADRP